MLTEVWPTKGNQEQKKHHLCLAFFNQSDKTTAPHTTQQWVWLTRESEVWPLTVPQRAPCKRHTALNPQDVRGHFFLIAPRADKGNELTWRDVRERGSICPPTLGGQRSNARAQAECCVLAHRVETPLCTIIAPTVMYYLHRKYLPSNNALKNYTLYYTELIRSQNCYWALRTNYYTWLIYRYHMLLVSHLV
jgi:hypothetical protein